MIKKILLSILMSLPMLGGLHAAEGMWVIHPYFVGSSATNCIDAGDKVYYLSKGSLYCYDKARAANDVLDVTGSLHGVNISQMYYNYDKGDLVVVYGDCNIDVVKSDGTIVNVSAVKEVIMSSAKTINDITFAAGKMYVATSFGYLTINDSDYSVDEVRNYAATVPSVAQMGNTKVISVGNVFYYCNAGEPVEALQWHHQTTNTKGAPGRIYPINDSTFFLSTTSPASLQVVSMKHVARTDGTDSIAFTLKQIVAAKPATVQPYPGGFVASFAPNNYYYTFDNKGNTPTRVAGNEIYTSQEEGNWWVLGANGLTHIVNGTRGDNFMPNGVTISNNAYWTAYDPGMQRVLLCRTTDNRVLPSANSGVKTEVNSWDGSRWRNITPVGAPNAQGNYWIAVSPNEPNTYFYSCRVATGGIVKVKNDTVVAQYTSANAPLGTNCDAIAFDSKGNLWMVQPTAATSHDALVITPENQLLTDVNSSMFIINDMDRACIGYAGAHFKWITFGIGAEDTKVYSAGYWGAPVVIWNNNDDLSLKQYKKFTSFKDQDGSDYWAYYWDYIKQDNDGIIWMGSEAGVISFDPREAFNDNFRINRLRVKKDEEGNDVDDVLLENRQVNCIDVDALNRKWLATNTTGLYLVSPDGSEILKHFDTSNSPLPSNQIYSVCCNRATGSVLVVTSMGVLEYFPDLEAGAQSYADVYAYPNPVLPNFTGMILIQGLMSNSRVVITDADGTVVKTLQSNGDTVAWDGCDETGNRMPTGYYNVYASQQEPDVTGEPLTRIAIIK